MGDEIESKLKPCPFCGQIGTTLIEENGKLWLGNRYSEPVSIEVRHWCPPTPGQPSPRMISRVGRDLESAIEAWNMRAG